MPIPSRSRASRGSALPAPPRPAVGYIRVSSEEQAREGVSLDAQQAKVRAYCALAGLALADVIVDAGESGKTLERPGLRDLLARIDRGEVGSVVITKLDRLTRRTRDLLYLVEDVLKARGVQLVSLSEQLDTATPAGVLMLTVLGALAQMEREQIAERTRVALHHKRDRGDRLGTTPLGFTTPEPGAALQPDARELEAVRLILRRRRRGGKAGTFRAIAAELTATGCRTKRGATWHASTVRGVWLRRRQYQPLLESAGTDAAA